LQKIGLKEKVEQVKQQKLGSKINMLKVKGENVKKDQHQTFKILD